MFRFSQYLFNSLKYYWRTNLGVIAGAAIATAVLVGALISGDSVKFSLLKLSLKRLGNTHYALESDQVLFRPELAEEVGVASNTITTGALHLQGSLLGPGSTRINQVHVYGIDRFFRSFAPSGDFPKGISGNQVAISKRVADIMELDVGDPLILRVEKELILPMETPVASKADRTAAIAVEVAAILSDGQLGRFSLRSNQFVPNNIFIDIDYLIKKTDSKPRNNLILCQLAEKTSTDILNRVLAENLRLEDINLTLRQVPGLDQTELISDKIFLNHNIKSAAESIQSDVQAVFGYFVNAIRGSNASVPYSFAVGVKQINSEVLADNDIILNQWTANELQVEAGDSIELVYFVFDAQNRLEEQTQSFQLKQIIPMEGFAADRNLMPAFPGLGDAETCGDWQPGIPINLDQIRPQDEAYWDDYQGTPKAFIALDRAQELWGNRFGDLTALRFSGSGASIPGLKRQLLKHLPPESMGLRFEPVLSSAISNAASSVDFGQLFMGLSFFIIISSTLLTGMLFIFNANQRSSETNTLLALGYQPGQIRALRLGEGLVLSMIGGGFGAYIGIQYSRFILYGLGSFWRDAVGFSDFYLLIDPQKVLLGVIAGIAVSYLSIYLVVRKQINSQHKMEAAGKALDPATWKRQRKWHLIALMLLVLASISIVLNHSMNQANVVAKFYTAAALVLGAGLYLTYLISNEVKYRNVTHRFSLNRLILSSWSKQSGRNLATIGLLAGGIFIVLSVGLNRHDPGKASSLSESGTGGYELFVETTLPVLDTPSLAQSGNSLEENTSPKIVQVQIMKRTGDDGSCLNLNLVQQPQMLGLRSEQLAGKFTFVKKHKLVSNMDGWEVLDQDLGPGVIPAVADMSVIQWGFGLGLGDTLHYEDEAGEKLSVILVAGLSNSVFQGSVMISEQNMHRYFPTISGYQVFLVDTPDPFKTQQLLERSLKDQGPEIGLTTERLAAFSAVENTYLSIFLMLGGLGLLIGTFGLGAVLLRGVMEHRQDYALLQALGFTEAKIFFIIASEQTLNLILGLLIGSIAAAISVLPTLSSGAPTGTLSFVSFLLLGMLINGLVWIALAVRSSFRAEITRSLQAE